jgi:hypothetical protein
MDKYVMEIMFIAVCQSNYHTFCKEAVAASQIVVDDLVAM